MTNKLSDEASRLIEQFDDAALNYATEPEYGTTIDGLYLARAEYEVAKKALEDYIITLERSQDTREPRII